MSCGDEVKRMIVKRSLTAGEVPTVPPNEDHRSGLWSATDIYKGELFFNVPDGKMYTRSDNGIEQVKTNAGDGEVIYKARVTQSGTNDPVLTEYLNPDGLTITAGRPTLGAYSFSGFSGLHTGNWEITLSKMLDNGDEALIFATTATALTINTYSGGSLSDGVLKDTSGSDKHYNIITVKKYD